MYSENYDILFSGNDLCTRVLSTDQIQSILESGDTTLSEVFEFSEYPSPNLDYDATKDQEIFSPLLNCDNDIKHLGSMLDDVLLPPQDQTPVSDQTFDHQIVISNQPERNVRFRYENEKNQAKEIQGKHIDNNTTLWPEIQITNPPACSATIYIQLVEQPKPDVNHQGQEGYVPSPNILFIKKSKNWQSCSNGITVIDDGDGNDGKRNNNHGVVKLRVDNLAANGGIINFSDSFHLGICRTKAKDVWEYLNVRNETNVSLPHLKQILIPPQNERKLREAKKRISSEFDTTRGRLCFHVQPHNSKFLGPVCSDLIVDTQAHQPLEIKGIFPDTTTDTGIEKAVLLCSKIENDFIKDKKDLAMIITFEDDRESKNRMVPIPKANIHQQSAVMFGKDSIEKLKTEKYPIDDYKIPTYREVMDKSIPKKSHVHATVRLARCSNSIKEIDEYSNAIDLIIFPENEEKQFGMCIGSPSDNSPCKYRSQIQSGSLQADGNSDIQTPVATVYLKPETNNNHKEVSENLTSGEIVEDIMSMESNKYDTTNKQKEVSSMGLTPQNVYNTANTLETIDTEILTKITKGKVDVAKQSSEEQYGINNYADNTGFVSEEKFPNDQMVELEDRFSLIPAPRSCPDTSSIQERSTAPMGSYRLGIFSKSSSSKPKRKQKEVEHFSRPELSAGLNSDTLVGPRKGTKGNNKEDAT